MRSTTPAILLLLVWSETACTRSPAGPAAHDAAMEAGDDASALDAPTEPSSSSGDISDDSPPSDVPLTMCAFDGSPADLPPFSGYDDRGPEVSCEPACTSPVADPFPPLRVLSICPEGLPWCGAAACGNGQRDTCQSCVGGCTPSTVVETCDGADLGGKSCADLGYQGGTLGCSVQCMFDTSRCATCVPDGCRVLACYPGVFVGSLVPERLVLAASETEIGALWIAPVGGSLRLQAYFARFSPTLEKLSQFEVGGLDTFGVALAPAPHGWTLATGGDAGLDLWSVDAQGQIGGSPKHLDEHVDSVGAAAAPTGATLFAWVTNSADKMPPVVKSTVYSPIDGSATIPAKVLTPSDYDAPTAAFVDGGFLVAAMTSAGAAVARVFANGTPDGAPHTVTSATAVPRLVAADHGARLVFGDYPANEMRWLALDRSGAAVGSPVTIAGRELVNVTPAVGFGDDTLVLFAAARPPGPNGAARLLQYARFNADGALVGHPAQIVSDPQSAGAWALARRGSEAVAAWVSGGCPTAINLARLAP